MLDVISTCVLMHRPQSVLPSCSMPAKNPSHQRLKLPDRNQTSKNCGGCVVCTPESPSSSHQPRSMIQTKLLQKNARAHQHFITNVCSNQDFLQGLSQKQTVSRISGGTKQEETLSRTRLQKENCFCQSLPKVMGQKGLLPSL